MTLIAVIIHSKLSTSHSLRPLFYCSGEVIYGLLALHERNKTVECPGIYNKPEDRTQKYQQLRSSIVKGSQRFQQEQRRGRKSFLCDFLRNALEKVLLFVCYVTLGRHGEGMGQSPTKSLPKGMFCF